MNKIKLIISVSLFTLVLFLIVSSTYADVSVVKVWVSDHDTNTRLNIMVENQSEVEQVILVKFYSLPKRIKTDIFEKEILEKIDDNDNKDIVKNSYVQDSKQIEYHLKDNLKYSEYKKIFKTFNKLVYFLPKTIKTDIFENSIIKRLNNQEDKDLISNSYVQDKDKYAYHLKTTLEENELNSLVKIFFKQKYSQNCIDYFVHTVKPESFNVIKSSWIDRQKGDKWDYEIVSEETK